MAKNRMTEQEFLETKQKILELERTIDLLRLEKNALLKKVRWYEFSEDRLLHSYKQGFAYTYFGKRHKDLSKEEKREYDRLCTAKMRRKIQEHLAQKGKGE